MSNYSYISIFALFCYSFLFLAFMAARKNKQINAFLLVLFAFLLWTGGSLGMRSEFWPGSAFWFDLSIVGMLFLPFVFFNFVHSLTESKSHFFWGIWLGTAILNSFLNLFFKVFIPLPKVVTLMNGSSVFEYKFTWTIVPLFICVGLTLAHTMYLFISYTKKSKMARYQLSPIFIGIGFLFFGHLATMFPIFKGFPTDVLSGIINAGFMFYALYRKRLFKMTFLVSRGVVYSLSTLLSALLFSNTINPIKNFILSAMPEFGDNITLLIAIIFTITTLILSYILRLCIDHLFIKEENTQAEKIRNFSRAVAKSLNLEEIMEEIVSVIKNLIEIERLYVCIDNPATGNFQVVHSTSPLEGKSFSLTKDNPAIRWLLKHNKCMLMSEFRRSTLYKSMWVEEKKALQDLNIQCLVPLKDEEDIVGLLLLAEKKKNKSYSSNDLNILDSINSIASIAVKNSSLYKKAFLESRIDELTGLLNRKYFYELLDEIYEKYKHDNLSLLIFNIDDFKLYNQLYGFKEGDVALQNIANIIQSSVGDNCLAARYGGKEFAVILPGCDILAAKNLAESIRTQIMNMNRREQDYALKVLTVSCGICSIPYSASNIKQLVQNADMAVYSLKQKGKNGVLVFDIGIEQNIAKEISSKPEKGNVYSSYESTILALTAAIDTKDHYTFQHSKDVSFYSTKLAILLGMNTEFTELVREAGLLHDIGKIGIPEHVLNKPGKLTMEEFDIMKQHVENSIGIIRNLPSLDYVIPAVIGHHERYDGKGYPRGLVGEDIPLAARILCIADAFDAMISSRTYKKSFSVEYALAEIEDQAGKQFDPNLAMLFVKQVREGNIEPNHHEDYEPVLLPTGYK